MHCQTRNRLNWRALLAASAAALALSTGDALPGPDRMRLLKFNDLGSFGYHCTLVGARSASVFSHSLPTHMLLGAVSIARLKT